jgi:hypothetical protein
MIHLMYVEDYICQEKNQKENTKDYISIDD